MNVFVIASAIQFVFCGGFGLLFAVAPRTGMPDRMRTAASLITGVMFTLALFGLMFGSYFFGRII